MRGLPIHEICDQSNVMTLIPKPVGPEELIDGNIIWGDPANP
jgi:hypothetical protein